MGQLLDRVHAAGYDLVVGPAERGLLGALRADLLADVRGAVVEIGAGTGANLEHLGPGVDRLTLLEPSPPMRAHLETRLRARLPHLDGVRAEVLTAPAEALPLSADSADVVVSTLVLCTVADPDRALAEIRRVLRPDGRLVVLEHVAADGPLGVAQRAIGPLWRVAGRGCHLRRDTGRALERAGFDTTALHLQRVRAAGPAALLLHGVASMR